MLAMYLFRLYNGKSAYEKTGRIFADVFLVDRKI